MDQSYAVKYLRHGPKSLFLFDIYENSTYDIQLELVEKSKKFSHRNSNYHWLNI